MSSRAIQLLKWSEHSHIPNKKLSSTLSGMKQHAEFALMGLVEHIRPLFCAAQAPDEYFALLGKGITLCRESELMGFAMDEITRLAKKVANKLTTS